MFALVDCNNFYCSCERVFNPKLEGRPVIVLSNNDGCAIARSEEAKSIGIDMGMPAFMCEHLVRKHDVAVFSSNYVLYGDMSARVMQILSGFSPSIELYSIDEAFLDLSELLFEDMHQLALLIRRTVTQYTGIPVTVGIAPTKTLAKMANAYAKKKKKHTGVYVLCNKQVINDVLESTPVGKIWGVGEQHEKLLVKHGITTAAHLTRTNDEWIRKNLSVVGHRMVNELRGIPCIKWEDEPPAKKGICTSRSFGCIPTDREQLKEAVSNYAGDVAMKLRKQKSCARLMQVFIQTNPFRTEERQYFRSVNIKLPVATNSGSEMITHALRAIDLIYIAGYKYVKAGVIVMDIIKDDEVQSGIFDTVDRRRDTTVMAAMDKVNHSLGKDMVRFAVQGFEKKWKLNAAYLSGRYTTRINELLTIKI